MKENIFKKMRLAAGLSQGDVAKKLGYTCGQFCSNWERSRSVPPLKSIRKLAKIFGVDADDFVETYKAILVQNYKEDLDKKMGKAS